MKQKSIFHYFILLLLSIGLVSCDKDDEVVNDDNTGERTFAEICKEVSDIDYAIVDYYKQSESLAELIEHIEEIRKITARKALRKSALIEVIKVKPFKSRRRSKISSLLPICT